MPDSISRADGGPEGKTSREIAKYLSISPKTAMTHRANLMAKLQVHSASS